jgi:nitrite reductase (NADH) large subunit
MSKGIVIIGAGPTGVTTVETLRSQGYEGPITMLTREPFPPYSPPLMADYLESHGGSDLIFWRGRDFCDRFDVNCRTSAEVGSVEPKRNRITLTSGEQIEYENLVIASGGEMSIPLRCECDAETKKERFYNFKSLTAVTKLLAEVEKGASKAVVIGAGFIGMEIAITLRGMGLSVIVVEMLDRILPRMLTKEIARPLEEIVRGMGIELLLEHKGEFLRGGETAEELHLTNGKVIKGDLFIAATGVRPNISFLQGSEIPTRRGVVVNRYLQAGYENVFAGGDATEVPDLITGTVYPHAIYPVAVEHGKIIGLNILGRRVECDGSVNANSLYHFKLPIITEGAAIADGKADEELVFERGRVLRKIGLKDGRILRFELIGDKKGAGLLHTLMLQKRDVSRIKYDLVTGRYNQAKHFMSYL